MYCICVLFFTQKFENDMTVINMKTNNKEGENE